MSEVDTSNANRHQAESFERQDTVTFPLGNFK